MQKTILITGANGQLGQALKKIVLSQKDQQFQYEFTDKDTLDITNPQALEQWNTKHAALYAIINCAAYTQVDQAEDNKASAFLLNSDATAHLVALAQINNAYFIHVSTDYVFAGNHHRPYTEKDATNPMSVYGKSKQQGEEHVESYNKGIVVRTSWLYSETGGNFVKTMLRLGNERDQLNVVDDQVGTPTYAPDLALAIFTLLQKAEQLSLPQIYHFSNEGVCSWYDFALAIMKHSQTHCQIKPIPSEDFPAKAHRPAYSVMSKQKIRKELPYAIPHWEESLQIAIKNLKQ